MKPKMHERAFSRYSIPFVARNSLLDRAHLHQKIDSFRGFYICFWLCVAAYMLTTMQQNYEQTGKFMSTRLIVEYFSNLKHLAWAQLCLSASTVGVWMYAVAVSRGWVPWRRVELTIQHACQAAFLATACYFAWTRGQTWIQRAPFVMYNIVLLMKIHAYLQKNSALRQTLLTLRHMEKHPERYPDPQEVLEARKALQPLTVRYPGNLTFGNWCRWLVLPTLVYELEYPRTERINWWYVVEKTCGTAAGVAAFYFVVEHHYVPSLEQAHQRSFIWAVPRLMIPNVMCYLMAFYVVFEGICNILAELTMFADRAFYDDWWSSRTFMEYARKWNRPVHKFLLVYVYLPLIERRWTKEQANLAVFLLSSFLHELVFVVSLKRVKMYLFILQMSQLLWTRLVAGLGKRAEDVLGIWAFWALNMVGLTILTYAYTMDFYSTF